MKQAEPQKGEKMVIVFRRDLDLSKGKTAAQAAHAAVGLALKGRTLKKSRWLRTGGKKIVVSVKDLRELFNLKSMAEDMRLKTYLVEDAGHTEVEPGTITCLGIGPCDGDRIDKITGTLPLVK